MVLYYHCIDLKNVLYGEIKADPNYSAQEFQKAYSWLEKEIGFYPLFLAVGKSKEDIRTTGYQNQFRKLLLKYPKEETANYVLFSFKNIEGIFMDYEYWHLVLNAGYKNYQITDYEKRLIFKPSWSKSKWLGKASKKPSSVQLITEKIYLPNASKILVRNNKTKKYLYKIGFNNIKVKRLKLLDCEKF